MIGIWTAFLAKKNREKQTFILFHPNCKSGPVLTMINLFLFVNLIHSKRFFPSFSSLFHLLCPPSICPDNEGLLRLPGIFSR